MGFDTKNVMTKDIASKLKKFESRLPKDALAVNYSKYGTVDFKDVKSLTLHARYATCGREFANTHPFIDNDISLVHNGGISNHLALNVNKISTCDSEAALQTYIQKDVLNNINNAQEWIDMLAGRWAFGIFGKMNNGVRVLDVVKGESNLYYCDIPEIGNVYATDKDDIIDILKDMKIELDKAPYMVESNVMYRYDAVTGEMIGSVELNDSIKNYKPITHTNTHTGTVWGKYGKWCNGVFTSYMQMSPDVIENSVEITNDDSGYDADEFPDLMKKDGSFDKIKVVKYCCDEKEPIIDRLYVWDEVFETTLTIIFDSLTANEQSVVELMDFQEDFHTAVKLMKQLAKQPKVV